MGTCKSCSVQQEERDEMKIDGRLGAPTNEPFLRRQPSAVVEVPCGVPVPSAMMAPAAAAAAAADQGSKPSPHSAPQQPSVPAAAPPKPQGHSPPRSQPQLPQLPPAPVAENPPPALLTGTGSPKGVRSPTRNAEIFRLVAAEKERLAAAEADKADAITAKVCVAAATTSTYEYAPKVAAVPAKAIPLAAKQASGALGVHSLSGARSADGAFHEASELEAPGVDDTEQEAPARSWAFKPSVGTWLLALPRPALDVELLAAVPDVREEISALEAAPDAGPTKEHHQEISTLEAAPDACPSKEHHQEIPTTQAAPSADPSEEHLEEKVELLCKPLAAAPDASPSTVCDEVADVESPLPNTEFEGDFCVEAVKAAACQATPWRFLPSVGTWAMRRPFALQAEARTPDEEDHAAGPASGRQDWARLSWKFEDAAEACTV